MKISIFIPSYNYGHYLPESIESVLSQTYSDFELIIVDDGSTDNSLDVIHEYAKQDKRIIVIEHKENLGVCHRIKDGLSVAQGEYFHGLSADDKYLPEFLEKTLKLLEDNPGIGVCCSDFGYFYDKEPSHVLTSRLIPSATAPIVFSSNEIPAIFQKTAFWIPGHTALVKRKLIEDYGFYRADLHAKTDWFLLHHIALFEGAVYLPETLALMRLHNQTYSSGCLKNKHIRKDIHNNLFKILEDPKNRELREKFKKSALLGFLFKDPQAIKHPKLWSFYPNLIQKSIRHRFKS